MTTPTETVYAIYAAFGRGDIPAILEHISPDVEWEHDAKDHGIPWLVPGRGRAHVQSFFQTLTNIEFHDFQVRNVLAGGQQVAGVVHLDATYRPTGKRIVDLEVHLWTFDEAGRIVRFRHIADTRTHWQAAQA